MKGGMMVALGKVADLYEELKVQRERIRLANRSLGYGNTPYDRAVYCDVQAGRAIENGDRKYLRKCIDEMKRLLDEAGL